MLNLSKTYIVEIVNKISHSERVTLNFFDVKSVLV